jgi:hypothetical protein
MWTPRDNARILPDVANAGIFLLLFQPGELARELLAHGPGHLKFEQEGAGRGVADVAMELAEITEIGCEAITDLADHWHVDHHPERGNAGGSAREGARLSMRIIPVCESVVTVHGDLDSSLFEKFCERHGKSCGKWALIHKVVGSTWRIKP